MFDLRNRLRICALVLFVALSSPLCGGAEPLPIEWRAGESFFRVDGHQTIVFGRNPTGMTPGMFSISFSQAAASGEPLARIHLTVGPPEKSKPGELDEAWCKHWEKVFDSAAEKGISIIPVLAVWADWNDGSRGENWHKWSKNTYNAANGGCAREPVELLIDSPCRQLWLKWLDQLVRRWQARPNIAAWEIFSEIDLVSNSSPEKAEAFVRAAAAVLRKADSHRRPLTASLSGLDDWPKLYAGDALNIVQIHPYGKNLDELILKTVPQRSARYGKPVLIGESGLDPAGATGLSSSPRAHIGMRHALWAQIVSGAMTGRMFWWEDGYDFYSGLNLRERYKDFAAPAAAFARRLNFECFKPVEVLAADGLKGAAIGNDKVVVGWFRDEACEPPTWPARELQNKIIRLKLPESWLKVEIEFFDTISGKAIRSSIVQDGRQAVKLPAFEDAIAFVIRDQQSK